MAGTTETDRLAELRAQQSQLETRRKFLQRGILAIGAIAGTGGAVDFIRQVRTVPGSYPSTDDLISTERKVVTLLDKKARQHLKRGDKEISVDNPQALGQQLDAMAQNVSRVDAIKAAGDRISVGEIIGDMCMVLCGGAAAVRSNSIADSAISKQRTELWNEIIATPVTPKK